MTQPPRVSSFSDLDAAADAAALVAWLDASGTLDTFRHLERRMADLMGARAGAHLLDVGSGTGDDVRALAAIAGPTGRAVGVDRSEVMVATASARGGPGEFVVGDVLDLPFPDGTFDACRCERVLVHVADAARAVREMFRVVRPGGRVVLMEADFETLVVDAPDRVVTRRVLHAACDELHNGWAGRGLYGHVRTLAGDTTRVEPITLVFTSFDAADRFFALEAGCERLVGAGDLDRERALRWGQGMRAADRAGRFFCAITGFVVVGERPVAGPGPVHHETDHQETK